MLFFVHLWSQSVNTFHMRIGTQGTTHICPKKYKGFPKNTYHLEFRPSWKPEHCASIMMYSERITILWENALKQTPNIFLTSSSFPSPTKNKYTKQTFWLFLKYSSLFNIFYWWEELSWLYLKIMVKILIY